MIKKILKDVNSYINKKGLTVREASEIFKVGPVVLWRTRNGKSKCSLKTLLALEKGLQELKKKEGRRVQTRRT